MGLRMWNGVMLSHVLCVSLCLSVPLCLMSLTSSICRTLYLLLCTFFTPPPRLPQAEQWVQALQTVIFFARHQAPAARIASGGDMD